MARTKTRLPTLTEKEVTAQVLDAARLYGIKLERRNVGMAFGASGRPVRFGTPGQPDWEFSPAAGPNRGRRCAVEIKREGFDPRKLRGNAAAHWARQRAAIEDLNAMGGFAFWTRDGADARRVFARLVAEPGLRVELDESGFCHIEDGKTEPMKMVASAATTAAFGPRLKALREARGVTRTWLAREIGRCDPYVRMLEAGRYAPGAEALERLADVLGYTMDELWRGCGRCEGVSE